MYQCVFESFGHPPCTPWSHWGDKGGHIGGTRGGHIGGQGGHIGGTRGTHWGDKGGYIGIIDDRPSITSSFYGMIDYRTPK